SISASVQCCIILIGQSVLLSANSVFLSVIVLPAIAPPLKPEWLLAKVTFVIVALALVQKPPPWPTALLYAIVLLVKAKLALFAEPEPEPYQIAPPVPDELILAALVTTLPSNVVRLI